MPLFRACLAALALAGCTALFPDREGQSTVPGTSDGTDYIPVPTTKAQFGTMCQMKTELIEDNCAAPDTCQLVSRDKGTTMCSHVCESNANCPGDSRCTDTPAGRICVPTCAGDNECQLTMPSGRCIPVTVTDSVCWTADATTGEVRAEKEPTIDRIQLLRKSAFGFEPGLPTPGADVQLRIDLKNRGLGDLANMSATVTPLGSASQLQAFTGGSVQGLNLPGYARLEGALTPSFRLAPELSVGTTLEFSVTFLTADATWESAFKVLAFGPTALPYVTDVELQDAGGQPVTALLEGDTTVRLYGRNVGFGDLASVSTTASVTTANGTLAETPTGPQPLPDSQNTPATALLYQGVVTRAAGQVGSVLLDVTLTEAGSSTWHQTVELPAP